MPRPPIAGLQDSSPIVSILWVNRAVLTPRRAEAAAASANIVLPFKGTILPVLSREEVTAAPRTAASTSSQRSPRTATLTSPTTASTVEAADSAARTKLVRPAKAFQIQPTSSDAELIKKRLFSIPSSHQVPPRNPDAGNKSATK